MDNELHRTLTHVDSIDEDALELKVYLRAKNVFRTKLALAQLQDPQFIENLSEYVFEQLSEDGQWICLAAINSPFKWARKLKLDQRFWAKLPLMLREETHFVTRETFLSMFEEKIVSMGENASTIENKTAVETLLLNYISQAIDMDSESHSRMRAYRILTKVSPHQANSSQLLTAIMKSVSKGHPEDEVLRVSSDDLRRANIFTDRDITRVITLLSLYDKLGHVTVAFTEGLMIQIQRNSFVPEKSEKLIRILQEILVRQTALYRDHGNLKDIEVIYSLFTRVAELPHKLELAAEVEKTEARLLKDPLVTPEHLSAVQKLRSQMKDTFPKGVGKSGISCGDLLEIFRGGLERH